MKFDDGLVTAKIAFAPILVTNIRMSRGREDRGEVVLGRREGILFFLLLHLPVTKRVRAFLRFHLFTSSTCSIGSSVVSAQGI